MKKFTNPTLAAMSKIPAKEYGDIARPRDDVGCLSSYIFVLDEQRNGFISRVERRAYHLRALGDEYSLSQQIQLRGVGVRRELGSFEVYYFT